MKSPLFYWGKTNMGSFVDVSPFQEMGIFSASSRWFSGAYFLQPFVGG